MKSAVEYTPSGESLDRYLAAASYITGLGVEYTPSRETLTSETLNMEYSPAPGSNTADHGLTEASDIGSGCIKAGNEALQYSPSDHLDLSGVFDYNMDQPHIPLDTPHIGYSPSPCVVSETQTITNSPAPSAYSPAPYVTSETQNIEYTPTPCAKSLSSTYFPNSHYTPAQTEITGAGSPACTLQSETITSPNSVVGVQAENGQMDTSSVEQGRKENLVSDTISCSLSPTPVTMDSFCFSPLKTDEIDKLQCSPRDMGGERNSESSDSQEDSEEEVEGEVEGEVEVEGEGEVEGDSDERVSNEGDGAAEEIGYSPGKVESQVSYTPARVENKYSPAMADSKYSPTRTDAKHSPARADSKYSPARADSKYSPARADAKYSPTRVDSNYSPAMADAKYSPGPAVNSRISYSPGPTPQYVPESFSNDVPLVCYTPARPTLAQYHAGPEPRLQDRIARTPHVSEMTPNETVFDCDDLNEKPVGEEAAAQQDTNVDYSEESGEEEETTERKRRLSDEDASPRNRVCACWFFNRFNLACGMV